MVISTCVSGRASLTTCLLRRLVSGRIDAIGLSVVMPEGPRRIPGRLSVAPASPAVSKNSGTYILSASSPFGFWLAACLSSRRSVGRTRSATARRVVSLAHAGLRSRRQFGKGREFDNVRHYLPGDNSEDIHWKAIAIAGPWRSCRTHTARFLRRGPRCDCAGGGPSQGSPSLKIATRRPS